MIPPARRRLLALVPCIETIALVRHSGEGRNPEGCGWCKVAWDQSVFTPGSSPGQALTPTLSLRELIGVGIHKPSFPRKRESSGRGCPSTSSGRTNCRFTYPYQPIKGEGVTRRSPIVGVQCGERWWLTSGFRPSPERRRVTSLRPVLDGFRARTYHPAVSHTWRGSSCWIRLLLVDGL